MSGTLTSQQPAKIQGSGSEMSNTPEDNLLRSNILSMVGKREYPKTCCPSEVARALTAEELQTLHCEDWRSAMEQVRQEAYKLYSEGQIEVTQRGQKVDLDNLKDVKGPIRLRKSG